MHYVGIDPHKQEHVVVICDGSGQEVARQSFRANLGGYQAALAWATNQAPERVWGCENPQSYGYGLAQFLVAHEETVYAVSPHLTGAYRRRSQQRSKNDVHDALAVARALRQEGERLPRVVLAGAAAALRVLVEHHDNLQQEATRERNRLHAQLLALEPDYKAEGGLNQRRTLKAWLVAAQPGQDERGVRWFVVCSLINRLLALADELQHIDKQLRQLLRPLQVEGLLAIPGVGTYVAAKLISGTPHPHLFASEAAWAQYVGVAPIPCSSGQNQRDRVNLGGNRQLNRAIHHVLLTQLRGATPTRAYYERKRAEGKTPKAAKRCAKRHIARRLFRALQQIPGLAPVA